MKEAYRSFGLGMTGLLVGFGISRIVFAQATDSPQASGTSTLLTDLVQEQQTLAQEWQTLASQGATIEDLLAWRQRNAASLALQEQREQALSLQSSVHPMPVTENLALPTNGTSTLNDFLETQTSLANAHARIHNQLLKALPANPTQEQVDSMRQQELQLLGQQHAADLQLQAQRAKTLGAESVPHPVPDSVPLAIPSSASPQLKAYLQAQSALAASWARVWNQYVTADSTTRQAAIQQWQQENAGNLLQLRELSQDLANSKATGQSE